MSSPIFVVSIHGGMLQDVFCMDREARVILVDLDTEGRLPTEPHLVEIGDNLGRPSLAYVVEYATSPLAGLAGDVASALSESDFAGNCELASAVAAALSAGDGRPTLPKSLTPTATAVRCAPPGTELLRRLIAWFDGEYESEEDGSQDELERIVAAARIEVHRPDRP